MRSVPGHNKYDLEYSVEKLLPRELKRMTKEEVPEVDASVEES